MEFLVNKSISSLVIDMLSKAADDNCLVFAYGYFDSKNCPVEDVWRWLYGAKNRHLILVVGIHGKPDYSLYLAATKGDGTVPLEIMPDDIENLVQKVAGMFKKCAWELETIEDPFSIKTHSSSCSRIHIVIAEHFHAKLAMTVKMSEPVNLYEHWPTLWEPTSAICGSSNMTYAAQQYNLELDVQLKRDDIQALKALAPASSALINFAIAATKRENSVSAEATACVINAISDLLVDALYDANIKVHRKEDAEYEASRREADRELD